MVDDPIALLIVVRFGLKKPPKPPILLKTSTPCVSFTSSLMQSFKNKIPTTQSALKTVRGGFQEVGQENIQEGGQKKFINAFVNYRAGEDILNTDYTFQDFWRTSLLSLGAGSAMVGVETRYQSPKKQLQNLFYVGSNYDAVKSRLNTDVINGNISQANADKLLFDGKAVYNQSSGIPSGTDPSIALPSSILMQEISDLENKKKNLDPAFHADVDAEIKLKKTELNNKSQILNPLRLLMLIIAKRFKKLFLL